MYVPPSLKDHPLDHIYVYLCTYI